MSKFLVVYVKSAEKKLFSLEQHTAQRIAKKIEYYSTIEDPLAEAKSLSGNMKGFYRYRVGDYRIIFSIDSKGNIRILTILEIDHRKDVYR
jgi:mRNA interferase RelE/StbE